MAFLIIKPKDHEVTKKDDPIYQKKCPHCGAVFQYQWEDMEPEWLDPFESAHIRCPECAMVSTHHWWYRLTKRKIKKNDQYKKCIDNKKRKQ